MKVLIAVTHLLGAGHLSRALTLGRAFAFEGHEVTVLSGGQPAPHMDYDGVHLTQLPAIASDGTNFTRLLTADGQVVDEAYMQSRVDMALATLQDMQPDVVITELFPFGRRSLSEEFLALLEGAKALTPRPRILCSIRDILAPPSKPSKAEKAQTILESYYDGVLVHSDPHITTLSDSWPVSPALENLLRYTGYVAPPSATPHPDGVGQGDVLVSAGGGSVGQALFECAIEAARQSDLHWRLLIGGKDRDARIAALKARADDLDITIESVRPDFRQMLHGAACSVSMCGYNTALDLLQTGIPAVLVPFDDGGEVEQTLRARSLAQQPAMDVLMAADMTPSRMAALVDQVMAEGHRQDVNLQMNGAVKAVHLTQQLGEGKA
ncbi:Predicted glycosyl transferase [Shimia gijangensis]|uniref:Predicted glycosyl transferase n=1 Tax=Shimia gijangensis TaxID=1470563 RepID=A0A1M6JQZ8_9RHOB|nr:glycosyltransferase [Shimia gijangensis]SHJ49088.1 Predicted glycosyl transferase [Shimia gijangensis]